MDQSKWHDAPEPPPSNKKKMEGGTYAAYGITNIMPKSDHIEYFLTHDNGTQRRGLLYHAERNPLKDVGHCWFRFDDRDVIMGIAIESDWICINDDVLATITPPKPAEKKELKHQETIDMGVYGDLIHGKWKKNGDAPHRGRAQLGFHKYVIIRAEEGDPKDPHQYKVFLSSDPQGVQSSALIKECKCNPFKSIQSAFLKIDNEEINGIMVEDDWVELV